MKKVLLTTPCGPYDTAWGIDMLDLLNARLARGHDQPGLESELPCWALYLIAENIRNPCTVLQHPRWDDFRAELAKGYDIVAIQLKTVNTERTIRMVDAIREHSPDTEIVLGGYGVAALEDKMPGDRENRGQYLKDNVDHLCREEGVQFMRRLLDDYPVDRPVSQYELPHARFSLPGMASGLAVNVPGILVALGCPNACEFCNTSAFFHHKKTYVAEPAEVYSFMKRHQERLGTESLMSILFDEDMFLNPDYVRELGRLIRSDRKTWGFRWITFGSLKGLSAFSAEELRECGLASVWIGVESGFTDGDKSKTGYAKRDGSWTPPELFSELHRYGIETVASMILGFDFHTPENIERDIDYFVALRPMFYQIAPLTPCPGTKLFRDMMKQGRLSPHYNFKDVHVWKEDTFRLQNFDPGQMKHYYDLAHEKLRAVNGPPVVQFCEASLRAYETMKDSPSEFLRFQAKESRTLARGTLPIVRAIGQRAPSPQVKARIKSIEALAERVLGRASLPTWALSKAVEAIAAYKLDPSDQINPVHPSSEPRTRRQEFRQELSQKSHQRQGAQARLPETLRRLVPTRRGRSLPVVNP